MSQLLAVSFSQAFGVQFWINVGLLAAIYGLFTAGMQLNIGTTGLYNFAQAGFMAVGAYAMGILWWTPMCRSGRRCRSPRRAPWSSR